MDADSGRDVASPRPQRRLEAQPDWTEPAPDDTAAQLDSLRRKIQQNDDEIDSMQIAAAQAQSGARRWWREPAVLISVLSLALAFGTTLVSSMRLDEERRHEARNELTGYIERLSDIPRQQAEILQQHPDANGANLASQLGTELLSIANQARSVIRTIPADVSTVEYMSVGYAFQGQGALDDAEELYRQALSRAANKTDTIFALRSLAAIAFLQRDFDTARQLLQRALDVFEGDTDTAAIVVATSDANTHLYWVAYELQAGNCTEAAAHADAAQQIVIASRLASLQLNVDQARAGVAQCVPDAKPTPAGSPSAS